MLQLSVHELPGPHLDDDADMRSHKPLHRHGPGPPWAVMFTSYNLAEIA
jgi:hypothetical protein